MRGGPYGLALGATDLLARNISPDVNRALDDTRDFLTNYEIREDIRRFPGRSQTKAKRKVSAYQKEFGRQLKKLKNKHPRTPATKLMKRAHTATKKVRRKK
tara:strand:- start:503 stop:805 length:303 start_codon:yes stop_codon:yes gene_type:complete